MVNFLIDEFNATKNTVSKMVFIIVNQVNRNIFDINNSRLSSDIEKYFIVILKNILKDIQNKKEIKLNLLQWTYINLIIN